jgi:ABC-2 type transport system ATP-binding protein
LGFLDLAGQKKQPPYILCGLLKPTSGTAKIYGYDVQKETQKVKELIGVCIQETAIYPYLTGKENLELFGKLYGMNSTESTTKSKPYFSFFYFIVCFANGNYV